MTVKLRKGVTWSDGQPFTAQDVVFTLNMLKANSPDLLYAFDMKTWVQDVTAADDLTAKITLTSPNPQFLPRYFTWFQDNGFPIVAQHVFQGQDQKTFTNLDLAKGWPVTTGPWKLVSATADQKIFDRNDDWWGAKTGFRPLPKMKVDVAGQQRRPDKALVAVEIARRIGQLVGRGDARTLVIGHPAAVELMASELLAGAGQKAVGGGSQSPVSHLPWTRLELNPQWQDAGSSDGTAVQRSTAASGRAPHELREAAKS